MDWRDRDAGEPDLAADTPTLLVIHGLNGHSDEACVLYSMVRATPSKPFFISLKGCCQLINSLMTVAGMIMVARSQETQAP